MTADKSDIIYRIAAAAFSNAIACPECVDVLVEARDEIERLRLAIRKIAEQDATLSVQGGSVTIDITDEFVGAFGKSGGPLMPFDPPQPLSLTDAERKAVELFASMAWTSLRWSEVEQRAATLRGLLERTQRDARIAALDRLVAIDQGLERDYPDQDNASKQDSVTPDWMARPYWVDPPSGHRYGFPKLYDPAKDGDMTEWLIAKGYPERLARQGLSCTFTATG